MADMRGDDRERDGRGSDPPTTGSGITKDSTTNSLLAHRRSTGARGSAVARDWAGCLIITILRRNQTRVSTRRLGSRMGHYASPPE
jgi:hypothetical protein